MVTLPTFIMCQPMELKVKVERQVPHGHHDEKVANQICREDFQVKRPLAWPWKLSKSFPGRQSRKRQPSRGQCVHRLEGDSMSGAKSSVARAKNAAARREGEVRPGS